MRTFTVGLLAFHDVEVLDLCGPFEVFSRTRLEPGAESRRSDASAPFDVCTVARTLDPIRAVGGLTILPQFSFADAPRLDLLVIPGGFGTRPLLHDEETIGWIRARAGEALLVASVCTGALLLAKAGLLEGRRATTHHAAHDLLASMGVQVERGARFVKDGVWTSAGVAAGIDMAFSIVEQLCGQDVADETAHYIEYHRVGEDAAYYGVTP